MINLLFDRWPNSIKIDDDSSDLCYYKGINRYSKEKI